MVGWSFPGQEESMSTKESFTSVSLSTKLLQMNLSLAAFELQLETNWAKGQPKIPQDLIVSSIDISDQAMMWDLSNVSSSMSGVAWVGEDSFLKPDSLIAMTSIGNEGVSSFDGREEKFKSGSTMSQSDHLSRLAHGMLADEVRDEVDQQVKKEVALEEKLKRAKNEIRGRAASALFWLFRKISRSNNYQF